MYKWKKISSKVVHKNPWYFVSSDQVIKPDGSRGMYYVVHNTPGVYIVAMNKKQEIVLINSFRYPTGIQTWELPAGHAGTESPLLAAKRELQEETGLVAKQWKKIGKLQGSPGIEDNIMHIFLATGLKQTLTNSKEEEGIGRTKTFTFKRAFQAMVKGKAACAQCVATLLITAKYLNIKF